MRQYLTTAIEQSAEAVYITDARGGLRYVNPSFELTGYSREEVLRPPEERRAGTAVLAVGDAARRPDLAWADDEPPEGWQHLR